MTVTDAPDPSTPDGADAPPRSVAEEAALLVELLSRRAAWGTTAPGTGQARPAEQPDATGSSGATQYTEHPEYTEQTGRGGPDEAEGPTDGTPRGGSTSSGARGAAAEGAGECTCGGTTPQACRICPVCQLIAFVQNVSPETIERVADFVGFAASALRDLATAARDRAESGAGGEPATPTSTDPTTAREPGDDKETR